MKSVEFRSWLEGLSPLSREQCGRVKASLTQAAQQEEVIALLEHMAPAC